MNDAKEIFDSLRSQGYRITPQREQILTFFRNLPKGDHLSAEELQQKLEKQGVKISLATLYRNLKFLVKNRLLSEIDLAEAHKHYEYVTQDKHHHHLICMKCSNTIEFEDEAVIEHVKRAAQSKKEFQVVDYQLKIFGYCENCINK